MLKKLNMLNKPATNVAIAARAPRIRIKALLPFVVSDHAWEIFSFHVRLGFNLSQNGFTSIVGFVVGIYLIAVAVIYFIWGFTHRKEVSMTEPLNGATNV
uniref:Uncharacterized protein n=1 Tax=Oxyrrhis marina TaxID=2969 RepID=A0A7S3UIG3_OXYMA